MVVTVFLYVNSVRTYQFKANHSEMKYSQIFNEKTCYKTMLEFIKQDFIV